MKKYNNELNKEKLLKGSFSTAKEVIKNDIEKTYNSLTSFEKLLLKWNGNKKIYAGIISICIIILFVVRVAYKKISNTSANSFDASIIIFGFVCIFLCIVIFMKHRSQKIAKKMVTKLNIPKIYASIFNENTNIKIEKIYKNYQMNNENTNDKKYFNIPTDATIAETTGNLMYKTNIGDIIIVSNLWYWVVSYGKNSYEYWKNISTIILKPSKWERGYEDYSFITTLKNKSLFKIKKKDNLNKVEFESSNFNNHISHYSNDGIKSRMIYTPLIMEEVLALNKTNKNVKHWILKKSINKIKTSYLHKHNDHFFINARKYKKTSEEMIEEYSNDIALDFVDMYTNLENILFLNLNK